ncbi:MAG: hypothetical protein IJH67_13945 [Thermoguttaceae bacterium]|nr:hypothetical protein [Thermoguttaceae bacterium]
MKTQDAEKKQKIKGLDRYALAVSRLFYLRYSQICATASHKLRKKQQYAGICETASRKLGEKQQILSTVSRKLGSIAGFGGKSVLPISPMASDLFILTPKIKQGKMDAEDGAVKTQSGAVNGTVNDTVNDTVNGAVKTPSGTLNGTLNGTLKGGQMSGQIGGQIGGQIDNAGIRDSVNHKFETTPEIMNMTTRPCSHSCFRSLPKNSWKNFCSNQIKEMAL